MCPKSIENRSSLATLALAATLSPSHRVLARGSARVELTRTLDDGWVAGASFGRRVYDDGGNRQWGLGLERARLACDEHLHLTEPAGQSPCPSCAKAWCRACHPKACPRCGALCR